MRAGSYFANEVSNSFSEPSGYSANAGTSFRGIWQGTDSTHNATHTGTHSTSKAQSTASTHKQHRQTARHAGTQEAKGLMP